MAPEKKHVKWAGEQKILKCLHMAVLATAQSVLHLQNETGHKRKPNVC